MKKLPILESYWVEEGRLLAGEHPSTYDIEITRHRMNAFLAAGIHTFIDLTQVHELTSYEAVLKEQARNFEIDATYHRFGIRDHTVPSREIMANILDAIDAALNAGRNVYVHCWGGIGRTGITVGCYLVRHGMANELAVAQVNKLYKTRPGNPGYARSPESEEQIEFILNWHEE